MNIQWVSVADVEFIKCGKEEEEEKMNKKLSHYSLTLTHFMYGFFDAKHK